MVQNRIINNLDLIRTNTKQREEGKQVGKNIIIAQMKKNPTDTYS